MWKPTAEEPTCHKAFVRRSALGRSNYNAEAFGQPWFTQAKVAKRVTPRQENAVQGAILEMTGGQTTYDQMVSATWDGDKLQYGFVFPISKPPLNHWEVCAWRRKLQLVVQAWTYVARMVQGISNAESPLLMELFYTTLPGNSIPAHVTPPNKYRALTQLYLYQVLVFGLALYFDQVAQQRADAILLLRKWERLGLVSPLVTNSFTVTAQREQQQINQLLAAAWIYLGAHLKMDPHADFLAQGWGHLAKAEYQYKKVNPDCFRCITLQEKKGIVTHIKPAKYAPNMIPELIKLANQLPSLYRPANKWKILEADRYIQQNELITPQPCSPDLTGRLIR